MWAALIYEASWLVILRNSPFEKPYTKSRKPLMLIRPYGFAS